MSSAHESNVARGLKAAIHNPNVSDQAKVNAQNKLEEMGMAPTEAPTHVSDNTHVLGGYKATLSNEHTSEQAKMHAREILEAADVEEYSGSDEEERSMHDVRVLAGYKAALSNPRVSAEAKRHAEEYLKEHDAL